VAPLHARTPPQPLGQPVTLRRASSGNDEIVFRLTVAATNYLAAMKTDGSSRRTVASHPISNVHKSSPDGRWIVALAPFSKVVGAPPSTIAIPLDGGAPREICPFLCPVSWALDGTAMQVRLTQPTLAGAGITAVIKLKPGEAVPELPAGGIRAGDTDDVPGLRIVKHTEWRIPWREEGSYAEVRATTHRNLFRITLPD
jgi:hypothetical protein